MCIWACECTFVHRYMHAFLLCIANSPFDCCASTVVGQVAILFDTG